MLIQHLNGMIEYGLLEKIEYNVYPKYTEYRLIEFEKEFIPILAKFQALSIKNLSKNN